MLFFFESNPKRQVTLPEGAGGSAAKISSNCVGICITVLSFLKEQSSNTPCYLQKGGSLPEGAYKSSICTGSAAKESVEKTNFCVAKAL